MIFKAAVYEHAVGLPKQELPQAVRMCYLVAMRLSKHVSE